MLYKYKDEFFTGITFLGSGYFHIILIVITLSLRKIEFFKILVLGFVLSYLIAGIIRLFYFKARPKKEDYAGLITKIDASSFPSIHSINSSFLAVVFSSFFNNIYTTIIFSLLVLAILYSRIYLKRHFYSDVIVGLVIGVSLGFALLRLL